MTAGWSGPEFSGYTNLEDTHTYDGPIESGVNEVIGLTGMVNAGWNLNLYSWPSTGPGTNMGAMFSNMGFFYNPPDNPIRHFKFRVDAELVFSLDRAGNFTHAGWALTENIGPFQSVKLESGTIIGNVFVPSSTLIDPLTLTSTAYLVPGTYRFKFKVDTEWDSNQPFGRGNNLIWQVTEALTQPPTAIDDFYGVDQLSALDEAAPGILVNDTDPDNDTLSVSLVDGPAHAASFQLYPDGSFTYVPLANYYGPDTFTYKAYDGTAYSETATVHITVRQPGSQGFITGGGKFFQDGSKCTFGFVAKVQGTGVQGNLEFQDHGAGLDVKSASVEWVYAPNQIDGYFSGACTMNGVSGYSYIVQVHDRGEPGHNDDFSVWVYDSDNTLVYTSGGVLSGGNIVIHGQ